MKKLFRLLLTVLLVSTPLNLYSQVPYEGPTDPAADPANTRVAYMNGNRFLLYFKNNTQLSDGSTLGASKWPNDYSGNELLDVAAVLIGAEVYITQDSIPVTDLSEVSRLSALGQIDTLFYVETQSYNNGGGFLDMNFDKTVEWELHPVSGYFNPAQDFPALSNNPDSWPSSWPSAGSSKKWPGEWNGRFGRGIKYADLESYFVANDAQDMENIINRNDPLQGPITNAPHYLPRPGKYIGDIDPTITTQRGFPWGGLGLRVEVRGYQWNNPEARDILFWEYNISNISDYDLPTCGFGYWVDPSPGGDTGGDAEAAYFDKSLDLTWIWDQFGKGRGGLPSGVFGFAFLESPGAPHDGIDNDGDGLVDEKRDNDAGQIIGPTDGITDMQKFLSFYHLSPDELRSHYEGDEDQDWQDGYDKNNNGTYSYFDEKTQTWQIEPGESSGDDVGLDGVGPEDLNYNGPDQGECNHKPDYVLGVGCEPNFDATDITETDQIGLTSMLIHDNPTWNLLYYLNQDKNVWKVMASNTFSTYINSSYIYEFFASAKFPFLRGSSERISMAMMAAYEDLPTLNSTYAAPTIWKLKNNAQIIYERDYRFAQPPLLPTLKAIPGDGKVTLIWDDVSDKLTHEPLLSRTNDFEGYKLYRSTDKHFQDAEIITNAQGIKSFKKPIFQCDKIDSITGYANFALSEGTAYYLGDDTGIKHHYIDQDVINGVTYYYALVAYDYGIQQFNISPTENNIVVELDEFENIIRVGKNVQIVKSRTNAAGYIPPSLEIDESQTSEIIKPGVIVPHVANDEDIKVDHTYRVTFGTDSIDVFNKGQYHHPMDLSYATSKLFVYDQTDNNKLVYSETPTSFALKNIIHRKTTWVDGPNQFDYYAFNTTGVQTDFFDGLSLSIKLPTVDTAYVDYENTDWITGSSPMQVITGSIASRYYPWDYDIIFTDTVSTHGTKSGTFGITGPDREAVSKSSLLLDNNYNFYVINKNSIDTTGNYEKLDLVVVDNNKNGIYDWKEDEILAAHSVTVSGSTRWSGTVFSINFNNVSNESDLPKPSDVYQIRFVRPYSKTESFVFSTQPEKGTDKKLLDETMDLIKVVPNPYIATNIMETAVSNPFLNQRRQIMFTHLPSVCTIKIFTPSGV